MDLGTLILLAFLFLLFGGISSSGSSGRSYSVSMPTHCRECGNREDRLKFKDGKWKCELCYSWLSRMQLKKLNKIHGYKFKTLKKARLALGASSSFYFDEDGNKIGWKKNSDGKIVDINS